MQLFALRILGQCWSGHGQDLWHAIAWLPPPLHTSGTVCASSIPVKSTEITPSRINWPRSHPEPNVGDPARSARPPAILGPRPAGALPSAYSRRDGVFSNCRLCMPQCYATSLPFLLRRYFHWDMCPCTNAASSSCGEATNGMAIALRLRVACRPAPPSAHRIREML